MTSIATPNMSEQVTLPPKEVLEHVVDVHCHPTDGGDIADNVMNNLHIRICAMSTHANDLERVADLARRFPNNVIISLRQSALN